MEKTIDIIIDEEGRISIPEKARNELEFHPGSHVTMEINNNKLILSKNGASGQDAGMNLATKLLSQTPLYAMTQDEINDVSTEIQATWLKDD